MIAEVLFRVLLPLEALAAALLALASLCLPAAAHDLLVLAGLLLAAIALPSTLESWRAGTDVNVTHELQRRSSLTTRGVVLRVLLPASLLAAAAALLRLLGQRDLPGLVVAGLALVLVALAGLLLEVLRARAPVAGVDYL